MLEHAVWADIFSIFLAKIINIFFRMDLAVKSWLVGMWFEALDNLDHLFIHHNIFGNELNHFIAWTTKYLALSEWTWFLYTIIAYYVLCTYPNRFMITFINLCLVKGALKQILLVLLLLLSLIRFRLKYLWILTLIFLCLPRFFCCCRYH